MYQHYSYVVKYTPGGDMYAVVSDTRGAVVWVCSPYSLLCGLNDGLGLWAVENNVDPKNLIEGKLQVSTLNTGMEIPKSGYVGKKTHRVEGNFIRVCDCFGKVHRSYHFYGGNLYIQWNLELGQPNEELPIEATEKNWVDVALEYDVKRFQGAFTDWV